MNLRLNRRQFTTAAAVAAPVALTGIAGRATQTDTTPEASPMSAGVAVGLTSTMEEWTAAAGDPEPIGESDTMFRYISPMDGVTPVIVAFSEDLQFANYMEYTFQDGGPTEPEANEIVAASIPLESEPGEMFLMPNRFEDGSTYTGQTHALPSSPNSIILSTMALAAADAEEARVYSISLALPSMEDPEVTFTGDPGGIGLSRDEWIAAYGEPPETFLEVEPYPGVGPDGMDVINEYVDQGAYIRSINVDSSPEAPVYALQQNGKAFIGASVPADSVVSMYYQLPTTDGGPIPVETMLITPLSMREQFGYDGSILAMIFYTQEEDNPGVQRIDIAMNSEG